MYMNARIWEPWAERVEAAGFVPVFLSWPYHAGEPSELRRHVDPRLGVAISSGANISPAQLVETMAPAGPARSDA
jgi:hypothetical protein